MSSRTVVVAELRRKNAIYRKQIREMQAALRVANLVMESQAARLVIRSLQDQLHTPKLTEHADVR